MSVSDTGSHETTNTLHRVASGSGVLLGAFLLLGGFGHLFGVRAPLAETVSPSDQSLFALLLPTVVLIGAGLTNIGLCRSLWRGHEGALNGALLVNALTMVYVASLLPRDVPGHPIGTFLALAACHVVLLGSIRLGLAWPLED